MDSHQISVSICEQSLTGRADQPDSVFHRLRPTEPAELRSFGLTCRKNCNAERALWELEYGRIRPIRTATGNV